MIRQSPDSATRESPIRSVLVDQNSLIVDLEAAVDCLLTVLEPIMIMEAPAEKPGSQTPTPPQSQLVTTIEAHNFRLRYLETKLRKILQNTQL